MSMSESMDVESSEPTAQDDSNNAGIGNPEQATGGLVVQPRNDNDSDNEDIFDNPSGQFSIVFNNKASNVENSAVDPDSGPHAEQLQRLQPQPRPKSFAQVRQEAHKVLKQFFKSAFTIIVKRRRLCPSEAFQTVRVLGVRVPRFKHPSSLEYVDEVSKKFILLSSRNATDGCVMHITVEKNKTLHVVQRFVFRCFGALDVTTISSDDVEKSPDKFTLESIKIQCRVALLQLLNTDSIKPHPRPLVSRWSLSVGMKNELGTESNESFQELWNNDPMRHYFPWRLRMKSLASMGPNAQRNVCHNLDFANCSKSIVSKEVSSTHRSDSKEPFGTIQNNKDAERSALGNSNSVSFQTAQSDNSSTVKANMNANNDKNVQKPIEEDNDNCILNEGTICFPISSFLVTANFMISIYGLDYPASSINISSQTPAKHSRNPGLSIRLSQLRREFK